jgi:hypothetical protein
MKTKNFYKILKLDNDTSLYLLVNQEGYMQACEQEWSHTRAEQSMTFPCLARISFDTETFYFYNKQLDAQPFVERFLNDPDLMNRDKPFDIVELLDFYSIHHKGV